MLTTDKTGRYISIKADGKFHEVVSKDTEGAVLREYELRDGTKGSKWELLYRSVDNVHITNIKFEDSDFGENILLTLADGENEVIWAENTSTNFGTDLMKKLPNVNFAEKLSIKPYSFKAEDTGKDKRGVNIFQKDKVFSFFYDPETKTETNGFPVPQKPRDEMKTADWKIYFLNVQVFLSDYTKEHIVPKFDGVTPINPGDGPGAAGEALQYPDEEINPEDVPF